MPLVTTLSAAAQLVEFTFVLACSSNENPGDRKVRKTVGAKTEMAGTTGFVTVMLNLG